MKKMSFAMYSDEGEKAVAEEVAKFTKPDDLPEDEDRVTDILDLIAENVVYKGWGKKFKSNRGDGDIIDGFAEVEDTNVREIIYDYIMDAMKKGNNTKAAKNAKGKKETTKKTASKKGAKKVVAKQVSTKRKEPKKATKKSTTKKHTGKRDIVKRKFPKVTTKK
jgi:hypothetical protein